MVGVREDERAERVIKGPDREVGVVSYSEGGVTKIILTSSPPGRSRSMLC